MTVIVRIYEIDDDPETAGLILENAQSCERYMTDQLTIDPDQVSIAEWTRLVDWLRSVSLEN